MKWNGTKANVISTLIVCALLSVCAPQQLRAQSFGLQATIDDLENLTGCSETEVRAAKTTIGTFPSDDKNKIFFLYNVKTGLLLNAGGYWGTHVSLQETGLPLWVHLDNKNWIHLAQDFEKTGAASDEGDYLEYENTKSKSDDNGVFVDRNFYTTYTSWGTTYTTYVNRGWKLELVDNKKQTYKLYTYAKISNNNYPNNSEQADNNFDTSKRYYLIAFASQGDVDKNCGAVAEGDIPKGNDEWKFISYEQIFQLQGNKTQNLNGSLDLTFKLQCPGFNRENGALSNWKTKKYGGNGNIRFGLEHYYKTSTTGDYDTNCDYKKNENYNYTFNKQNYNHRDDYERQCGKYYCADIKNARGVIYQDVTVVHGGAYIIECKAFSTTTKAKLFSVVLDENGNPKTNTLHATVVGQTKYMSDEEKTALHINEQNMDYAGKEFYGNHKYTNSVLVQVPDNSTIRFGIEVGSTSDTQPEDGEWTVFDDFRLLFASKTTDGDLILDEDRDNLDYLKDCSNTYTNVILHLNKKFEQDKWNSFVLPVDLTKDQLTQAFGPNVRLAELNHLTKTEIQFKSIDFGTKGNSENVLLAYHPYIIFPTKYLDLEVSPAYKAMLTKTGAEEAKGVSVIVKKNHVDIPNVSFYVKGSASDGYKNDLDNMDVDTWTTNITPTVSGDGTMTAYGTFARTFGEGTQDTDDTSENYGLWNIANKSQIIGGRDDLKGCYFFDKGNMYYSATRPRGLRGFNVWFSPKSKPQASEAKFFLDGIEMDETTGIANIFQDEQKIEKFTQGVYNLNGQLVSEGKSLQGLPSGIYIVNGKKVCWK